MKFTAVDLYSSWPKYFLQEMYTPEVDRDLRSIQEMLNRPTPLFIMGEVKAGKTSFINALLGRHLLATGPIPTTAIVTHIRYGKKRLLYEMKNGETGEVSFNYLRDFTSEKGRVLQKKRDELARVIIYYPHPLLKTFEIIDSPGLNSLHTSHTESTTKGLTQAVHIIYLFRYGAVGRQTEINTLKSLAEKGYTPLGIVTKIDHHQEGDVSSYIEKEYQRLKIYLQSLIGVSSFDYFEYLSTGDEEAFIDSNFEAVFQQLQNWESLCAFTNREEAELLLLFQKVIKTLDEISTKLYLEDIEPLIHKEEKLQAEKNKKHEELLALYQSYVKEFRYLQQAKTDQTFITRYEEEIQKMPKEVEDIYTAWVKMKEQIQWHEKHLEQLQRYEEELRTIYESIDKQNDESNIFSVFKVLWERRRLRPIIEPYEEDYIKYHKKSEEYSMLYEMYIQQSKVIHLQMNLLWQRWLEERKYLYQVNLNSYKQLLERINTVYKEQEYIYKQYKKEREQVYRWIRGFAQTIESRMQSKRGRTIFSIESLPTFKSLIFTTESKAENSLQSLPKYNLHTFQKWLQELQKNHPYYEYKPVYLLRYQKEKELYSIKRKKRRLWLLIGGLIIFLIWLLLNDWWELL